MRLYALRFPNREVEIGFYEDLLRVYIPESQLPDSPFRFTHFKQDLFGGRPHDFMARLASLLKDLPGADHKESSYRAITYLLAVLSGSHAIAEHDGYKGRSDIEVIAGRYIYIFEFKYNKSVEEAMGQLHSRDYAGRYAMEKRKVFLIGANFENGKQHRGLTFRIEDLN